jgi:tripartite ATP-independent transporter DctP family solute receptor
MKMTKGMKAVFMALITAAFMMTCGWVAAEDVVIKFATGTPKTHPQDQGALFFADMVKKESNGEIDVQVFHSGALGGHREAMEGMQLGTIQMFCGALAFQAGFYRPIAILELPFLFRDLDHSWKVKHGPIGKKLQAGFLKKTGVQLIGWGGGSFQGFYNSKLQIKTLEDMKGLKMRVMNNPVRVAYMNIWGAKATPMAFGEFYSAMEQKVVDGGENSYATYSPAKHYEVAKYFTESDHTHLATGILISDSFYKKLSPKHKAIIDKAATAADRATADFWKNKQGMSKKEAMDHGAQIYVMPKAERARFEAAVKPIYEKFAPQLGGMEMIEAIKATN